MKNPTRQAKLPRYRGKRWIRDGLPSKGRDWLPGKHPSPARDHTGDHTLADALREATRFKRWKWPKRPVFFVADPHADAEAFGASLVASGGVRKTGSADRDFELTGAGRKGMFVIGGDCLDKGPSSLRLLRAVRHLIDSGARVKLLAGNHDMRLWMGIRAMGLPRTTTTEHFFLRMGPKVVPLLKEVHESSVKGRRMRRRLPSARDCRRKLYPSKRWFENFPREASWLMSKPAIERELGRMRRKLNHFEDSCAKVGLSLRDVYAAALRCEELFLKPKGEFSWFYRDMQLAHREGSFLFIHAGLDDRVTQMIANKGVAHLNRQFRLQMNHNLFEFYYGPLANTMRTKYRDVDMPLTHRGVSQVHKEGVHVIVHGHRNRTQGQLIMLRHGMIHIESDITMDRNSRRKEGLDGYGAGVTIVRPEDGRVLGISTDCPHAKVFEPATFSERRGR